MKVNICFRILECQDFFDFLYNIGKRYNKPEFTKIIID